LEKQFFEVMKMRVSRMRNRCWATLVLGFGLLAGSHGYGGAVNYVTAVDIDGQKVDGSFLSLGAGDGKVLTVKSRKALQLQTVELTVDMKVPIGIKYEKLAAIFVRTSYHCAAPEFHRRFSVFNHRAQRWLAMKRGTMEAGRNDDEMRLERISDYVDKQTRAVRVRLYLEQAGEEQYVAKFDHFSFAGKPQPRVSSHVKGQKMAGKVKKEPNMRVHQAEGGGTGKAQQLADEFREANRVD
jgi:hypothetical protein